MRTPSVILAILIVTFLAVQTTFAAPLEGTREMAELTQDDVNPLKLVERQDIKHQSSEAFYKAFSAQKSGQWELAIANYQKAADWNPDMYEAFYNLGLCFERKQEWSAAQEAFKTAVKIDWSNPVIYKHLAYLSYKQGDPVEAKTWLDKYLHR